MNLASLIHNYRKRRSIGRYINRLGPALAQLYGKSKYYNPEQVKAAAKAAKLPMDDLCYGLSIYCTPDDFADYHIAEGEDCNYWEMRVEVAEHHFHGNTSFTQQDVVAQTETHSPGGGDFSGHHGGDWGGHHGGDGGGHF